MLSALAENLSRNKFLLDGDHGEAHGHGYGHGQEKGGQAHTAAEDGKEANASRGAVSVRRLRWGQSEDIAAAKGIAGPVRQQQNDPPPRPLI